MTVLNRRRQNVFRLLLLALCLSPIFIFAQNEDTDEVKEESAPNLSIGGFRRLIEGQLQAMGRGDYAQAYFIFTSSHFRNASSLAAFTEFGTKYAEFWRNAKIEFDDAVKEGALIKIKGILSTEKQQMQVTYYLIKEGAHWKILGVNLSQVPPPNPNAPQAATPEIIL